MTRRDRERLRAALLAAAPCVAAVRHAPHRNADRVFDRASARLGHLEATVPRRGARDFDYEIASELAAQLVLERCAGGAIEPPSMVALAIGRRARMARNLGVAAIVASVFSVPGLVLGAMAIALAADAGKEIAHGGIDGGHDANLGRTFSLFAFILSLAFRALLRSAVALKQIDGRQARRLTDETAR